MISGALPGRTKAYCKKRTAFNVFSVLLSVRWRLLIPVFAACAAFAQRPPVVLVDGYHIFCESGNLVSDFDFGELEQRLRAEGVSVTMLATCSFAGKPSIEDLGNALGAAIRNLNVPQVDIVTHSLGGLMVRAYFSGKQNLSGQFQPPADTKIRKWVSIATPNFGALLPSILTDFAPDAQVREMIPGSQFLFDLATWNQNHDDLRGIDAIAIIGNAGGIGPLEGSSDGTVAVTSGSLSFVEPDERTRVLPYCHGASFLTSILGLGCSAPPLAKIGDSNPLSWSIIDSFLSGTSDWKSVGISPSQDKILSQFGGVLTQTRDSQDQPIGPIRDQNFVNPAPAPGTYAVTISKPGPHIALVISSAARLPLLSLAPRMLISIYGNSLTAATVSVNGQALAINYSSDGQINALLPETVSAMAKLTVSNAQGRETVNIFVEDAVPAVFTADGSGTGRAATIRTGDFVSLYLTGLGTGGIAPVVMLNGAPVTVTYAGPAPGFAGLDQINFQLPAGVTSGTVVVVVGKHASNPVTI
jgi:uncharacterized protein (TIGR03437 family)